jgi:hypothetical protein
MARPRNQHRSVHLLFAALPILSSILSTGAQAAPPSSVHAHGHSGSAAEQQRAGFPRRVAPWAKPFPDGHYRGYYVGGGAACFGSPPDAFHGENRRSSDGTFGVDYMPWYSRVRLHWFHGRKQQGGEGQYESDKHNNPFTDQLGFGPRSVHKHKLIGIHQH